MAEIQIDRLLLDAELIDEQSLSLARNEALVRQRMLAEVLIDLGFVDQRTLAEMFARVGGIPLASPIDLESAGKLATHVATHLARKHMTVPIDRDGDVLVVAMIDPYEPGTVELLESTTGMKIERAVGVRSEVETAVIELYGTDEETEITLLSRGLSLDLPRGDGSPESSDDADPESGSESSNGTADDEGEDTNRTLHIRPSTTSGDDETADESTAPTVTRGSTEALRLAHVEKQTIGIMRALALIQARLDAIDNKLEQLVESSRVTR